jgi:coatomer subunit beta
VGKQGHRTYLHDVNSTKPPHSRPRDLNEYLNHIQKSTNMNCLTPQSSLKGDCGFLSANLHARSVFGEDALANVSIEQGPGGRISGTVKIRSKTQGIAVSLGKKVEACSSPTW